MKYRLKLLFLGMVAVSLFLFPESSPGLKQQAAAVEAPDIFESGPSREPARAFTASLSEIPQREKETEEGLSFLPDNEEELPELTSNTEQPETLLPQHSFQPDSRNSGELSDRVLSQNLTSQTLLSKFNGIAETGKGNLDPILAVGPTRMLIAVNDVFAIYTKTGQKRFQTTFKTWFSKLNVAGISHLFDPKVIYDQYSGRYFFICDALTSTRSWFLLSVSNTSDPEGKWTFWALDMQYNSANKVKLWADYPRIGVDQDSVYLTAGMNTFGTPVFQYAKIRILKKSEVFASGDLNWYDFWNFNDATGNKAVNVEPVQNNGTTSAEYFVNIKKNSGSTLTLWTLKNATSSNPTLTKKAVHISSYQPPPWPVQKGGGTTMNPGYFCVVNAVLMNGSIYTAFSTGYDWGSGKVAALRYLQINTAGAVVQEITYGAATSNYIFPVVMPDNAGNVIVLFNRCGSTEFTGIAYTSRKVGAPPGTLQPSTLLQAGLTNYNNPFAGSTLNHWGDFNGIALNPDNSFWLYSEFVKGPDLRGTLIFHLAAF